MALETYRKKRNFRATKEPRGHSAAKNRNRFVVQEHHARKLHFDFRLEIGGVLKSWAVPKGPSMNPHDKRLAVEVEDHPVEYISFKGRIEEGNYGAGEVAIWDSGTFMPVGESSPADGLKMGKLKFRLRGGKLRGEFHLVRMSGKEKQWLLIKTSDEYSDPSWRIATVLADRPEKRSAQDPARRKTGVATRSRTAGKLQSVALIEGAIPSSFPEHIVPMLATLVDRPVDDSEWYIESKWDGVRALCFIRDGKVRLQSRNGKQLTMKYPEMKDMAGNVKATEAVIDGEIVALNEKGIPEFQLLQSRIGFQNAERIARSSDKPRIVFYAFDLLYVDGYDLSSATLEDRKALLNRILVTNDVFRYSEHTVGNGTDAFQRAGRMGLEGIVAKRSSSPYLQRRSSHWLKVKTSRRQDVVICGYTQPRNTRKHFGALVVGIYDGDRLRYAGHVGGGFNGKSLEHMFGLMQPLGLEASPFERAPKTNEPVQWIKPLLVCEVKFAEWTREEAMRQPIFIGLREDKDPKECKIEVAGHTEEKVGGRTTDSQRNRSKGEGKKAVASKLEGNITVHAGSLEIMLTHLDKVYFPATGHTKGDLIEYYTGMRDVILPYLKDRPLILRRHPNGIAGPSFYQHEVDKVPEYVVTAPIRGRGGKTIRYIVCNSLATLLYVVNLGTITQHPWHSRLAGIDEPDWMAFDLDPHETDYGAACEVALALKDFLAREGLVSYAKTSGSRGLHVYVPLSPGHLYPDVAKYSSHVARNVDAKLPSLTTLERSPAKRKKGTVYIDVLQNARGKSIAAPYSVRAREGALVSAPLEWPEVAAQTSPRSFTMDTMVARLASKGDLFRNVLTDGQRLPPG